MTKAELLELLNDVPDDADICDDTDACCLLPLIDCVYDEDRNICFLYMGWARK